MVVRAPVLKYAGQRDHRAPAWHARRCLFELNEPPERLGHSHGDPIRSSSARKRGSCSITGNRRSLPAKGCFDPYRSDSELAFHLALNNIATRFNTERS